MKTSQITISPPAQAALDLGALDNGMLCVMPTAFYQEFRQVDLSGFCHRHGLYCLPTTELVTKINALILEVSPTRHAIEIGSGNGALGKALGIPCTDSHLQEHPAMQAYYAQIATPRTTYGQHVERLDAEQAVAKYRPEVVVAAWVTHKYSKAEHARGGNVYGVDEIAMLGRIKRYIFVGNFYTHQQKPLLNFPYTVHESEALFSRSLRPHGNGLVVWDRGGIPNPDSWNGNDEQ